MRTGVEVKTPRPRNVRASKPDTPASKLATADGPPLAKVIFSSGARVMYRASCGGMINMFGETEYRFMRALHSSTARSKPRPSFCTMPYILLNTGRIQA